MNQKGVTLIELLIVVIIVGILAAIAMPTYNSYMRRSRRVDGKTALEQLRAAQEMWREEKGNYSVNLTELQNTSGVSTQAGDYTILLNSPTATSYMGEAQPWNPRQIDDGSLFIDQDGTQTPADKWAN